MKNTKGFVWLPVLLILLGVAVVGGGAYYFVAQNTPSQTAVYQEASSTEPVSQTNSPTTQATTNQPVPTSTKVDPQLSASPTSGIAPLGVSFSASKQGLADGGPYYMVNFGDGIKESTNDFQCGLQFCSQEHVYATPGTYKVTYSDSTGKLLKSFSVQVNVQPVATYQDADRGFTFTYPQNLSASLVHQSSGATAMVGFKDANGGSITIQVSNIGGTFANWLYGDGSSQDTNYHLLTSGGHNGSLSYASTTLSSTQAVRTDTICAKFDPNFGSQSQVQTVYGGVYYSVAANHTCDDPSIVVALNYILSTFTISK